jgi:hypothetical protein
LEPLTEPALPVPLPRPLSDPLRRYRWLLLFLLLSIWAPVVFGWLLPDVQKVREAAAHTQTQNNLDQIAVALGGEPREHREAAALPQSPSRVRPPLPLRDTAALVVFASTIALLLCAFCILPRRAANALYLRSFRNDAETGDLRLAAQAALGRAFRLSGIRDPRRRWPAVIRHLLYILFLIRYAQPQFMNLEAGRDWKARLWRSLGDARCALIDVTELTPFLREEIELAIRCLGFHRVLFIGDDSLTADEWREAILAALGSTDVPPERVRVAIWADSSQGRASFKAQVRAFAGHLPADPPGLNPAAFPETPSSTDPGGNAVTGEGWQTFLLANLIGTGIVGALFFAENRWPDAGLTWFLPAVIYNTLAFFLLLQYLAVCGSLRERLRIGATFLFGAVVAGLPVVVDLAARFEGERKAVTLAAFTNKLKQIRLAPHDQHPSDQRFPPADTPFVNGSLPYGGTYAHILPYLEQGNFYGWYHPTVNGRQIPFAAAPIRTYLCPSDRPGPAQQTPDWGGYAAGIGGDSPWGPILAGGDDGVIFRNNLSGAGGHGGVRIADIPDGTSNTIFVGEMGLDSQDRFLLADGSVHFRADGLFPATFQALSTRNGGEVNSGNY